MIDRKSRDKLAETLRQYVSGRITNFTLDDLSIKSKDRGVIAVRRTAWFLYDDLHEHKARGKYSIEGKNRDEVSRWIVFLHSDQEYLWPPIHQKLLSILTFGFFKISSGDEKVWPFFDKKDFDKELRTPRLLNLDRSGNT